MERIALNEADVAYLVGKSGQTRQRLERFSGARLEIDKDIAVVEGTAHERRVTTVAVYLEDHADNEGGLSVAPGSHRNASVHGDTVARLDPWSPSHRPEAETPFDLIRSGAGDAVVFGLGLLHMSTANLTDRVRLSADVRWQPRSEKVDPRYVGAVDAADRVASGARATDGAATAGRVSIGDLKRRWGFAPFVAPV